MAWVVGTEQFFLFGKAVSQKAKKSDQWKQPVSRGGCHS